MAAFETALKKYLNTFEGQEMYFTNDTRNLTLFKGNPTNTSEENIRMKVSAVSDIDLRNNNITDEMIAHILELNIDGRLQRHDLTVVENIASLESRGQQYNMLHFASAYCNLHDPDTFPVYSEQHFPFYREYIKEFNLPLDVEKLNTYPVFCAALNDLVKRLHLKGRLNYLQLRKFGWLYAEHVLRESTASAT
jgi:hypothetical protein